MTDKMYVVNMKDLIYSVELTAIYQEARVSCVAMAKNHKILACGVD